MLRAVLGPDYGNEVEYLRVFVNQLRKKIELDPVQARQILTEPWRGYLFDALRFDPLGRYASALSVSRSECEQSINKNTL
jgi:hypothetical protein